MAESAFYATGRRKESVARVWIFPGQKGISVNGQEVMAYLKRANLQVIVEQPLKATQNADRFRVRARVHGGGLAGQAGAIRLGIARALCSYDEKLRSTLRQNGFMTRDPREKERKKTGRKGARKSFQYTKR
jgi:small subunit ribosomal protein S9